MPVSCIFSLLLIQRQINVFNFPLTGRKAERRSSVGRGTYLWVCIEDSKGCSLCRVCSLSYLLGDNTPFIYLTLPLRVVSFIFSSSAIQHQRLMNIRFFRCLPITSHNISYSRHTTKTLQKGREHLALVYT